MGIQIFILCKLMEDNNYPYKLKKQLAETTPLVQLGGLIESNLYYNFESLAKHGLIETVEIIKEDNRPDKQVYAITTKGREALPNKIYELIDHATTVGEMIIGLANIHYVDRDKVLDILEKKLKRHNELWEYLSTFEMPMRTGTEKFLEFIGEYATSKSEQIRYWLERTIQLIQQGGL